MWLSLIILMLCAVSCRDKGSDEGDPDDMLTQPSGLALVSPNGWLYSFDIASGEVTYRGALGHSIANDVVINSGGDRLFIADGSGDRILSYRLPDLAPILNFSVGGTPFDIKLDMSAAHCYILTRNGILWLYSISSQQYDSLEVGQNGRRMCLLPPEYHKLWAVCPGDLAIYEIDLRIPAVVDTLHFLQSPYDVCFDSDGNTAYVSTGSAIHLISPVSMTEFDQYPCFSGTRDIAISRDGRYLAAVDSAGGRVRVWDMPEVEQWDVMSAEDAGRPRFVANSHELFVPASSTSRAYKFALTDFGVLPVDTVIFPATLSNLMLWESTD